MPPFLRRLALVKPGETPALVWSAAFYFCILFGYYLLRPYRDEMGIRGDLDKLPWLWTGTTLAMLGAAPLFGLLVSRLPRRLFIPITYLFLGANLLVFYALFLRLPARTHLGIGYAFYIWLSVANLFMTSLFWGFMADLFTPEQGKRLFGAIGVGGTLGAIGGSSIPATLVKGFDAGRWHFHMDGVHLLPLSVAFLLLAVLCATRLFGLFGLTERGRRTTPPDLCEKCGYSLAGLPSRTCPECGHENPPRPQPARGEPGRGVFTGFVLIARSPYLLTMAAYMLLFTVTGAFLAFEQARIVKASFEVSNDRVAFLARIDLWVNVVTLLTQLFLTGRILTRLGLLAGLLLLPVITGVSFAFLATAATPSAIMLVMVARRGMHYAVDRPTREVLYTILGPDEKYKSKSIIDTLVYRGGDLMGIWTNQFLAKAGVAVLTVGIGLSVAWAATGAILNTLNKRLSRRPSGIDTQLAQANS